MCPQNCPPKDRVIYHISHIPLVQSCQGLPLTDCAEILRSAGMWSSEPSGRPEAERNTEVEGALGVVLVCDLLLKLEVG